MNASLAARFAFAVAALMAMDPLEAKYAHVDLVNVPVQRLIDNLEKRVAAEPANLTLRRNLARVYAMAYASDSDTVPVRAESAKGAELAPWFGYEPPLTYEVTPKRDKKKDKRARGYLAQALVSYERILDLAPDDLVSMLGHAWCLEQSGEKDRAITEYRAIIREAWPRENRSTGQFGRFVTEEAARYLLALLDKEKYPREVALLQERVSHLEKIPRAFTPIAIPLGAGVALDDVEDRSASVAFDADGSGLPKRWTWITPNAGWLVFDPHGMGNVASGLQLFGNVTFWMFWQDGYQALAALDDDGDGELSGAELNGLAVWQDGNGNGVSEIGEVHTLREMGIVALSLHSERHSAQPESIRYSPQGVRFEDGSSRPTYDIVLYPRSPR